MEIALGIILLVLAVFLVVAGMFQQGGDDGDGGSNNLWLYVSIGLGVLVIALVVILLLLKFRKKQNG